MIPRNIVEAIHQFNSAFMAVTNTPMTRIRLSSATLDALVTDHEEGLGECRATGSIKTPDSAPEASVVFRAIPWLKFTLDESVPDGAYLLAPSAIPDYDTPQEVTSVQST